MSDSVGSAFVTEPMTVKVIADGCSVRSPGDTKSNIKLPGGTCSPED
jgi:hypothetical protein